MEISEQFKLRNIMATKKVAAKKTTKKETLKKALAKTGFKPVKTKKLVKIETVESKKKTVKVKTPSSDKAKAEATQKGIPYIQVLGIELDPSNPTFGAFTLDWNALFVKQLKSLGYIGDTDEKIIDQWFQKVCHHVYLSTFEQAEAAKPGNGRRTQRKSIGNGLTEIM